MHDSSLPSQCLLNEIICRFDDSPCAVSATRVTTYDRHQKQFILAVSREYLIRSACLPYLRLLMVVDNLVEELSSHSM